MFDRKSCASLVGLLGLLAGTAGAESPNALFSQGKEASGWRFGIGTGLSTFSLDGELGFATSAGGVIGDIDLDNSDTRDLVESGFGLSGVAINGPWSILASIGTVMLEDRDRFVDAEWERSRMELLVGYRVLEVGSSQFSVVGGLRNVAHDWNIELTDPDPADARVPDVEEDWIDVVIGAAHTMPIADRWLWSNRMDMGFGDTEKSVSVATTVQWMPFAQWAFNASIRYTTLEVGDAGDVDDADFYYYDVDEPSFGVGFLYLW